MLIGTRGSVRHQHNNRSPECRDNTRIHWCSNVHTDDVKGRGSLIVVVVLVLSWSVAPAGVCWWLRNLTASVALLLAAAAVVAACNTDRAMGNPRRIITEIFHIVSFLFFSFASFLLLVSVSKSFVFYCLFCVQKKFWRSRICLLHMCVFS